MSQNRKRAAIILAAGQGTRMKSPLPKVLHRVAGRAMMDLAIDAAEGLDCERIVVVVGAHSPQVGDSARQRLGADNVVVQDPPLGTGHAVLAAKVALSDFEGQVVVSYADCPLIDTQTLKTVFDLADKADLAVLGFEAADPGAYGRLVIEGADNLSAIVEAKEATAQQLAIRACNSGVLAADRATLFSLLDEVRNDNAKGEYYLTDVVGIAKARGLKPKVCFVGEEDVTGVNSQVELAAAEAIWQSRCRKTLMLNGVTMPAPETVFLSWDTQIAPGVVVEPNVVFAEGVSVASGAVIRAFSHLEGACVAEGALIGPYARLRPGADIGKDVHIGNFVEVKNVRIGEGAKANHLSYLGDGEVGAKANIGAGTIFCNYDGYFKHRTVIGEGAFVGSNASLVAPVTVGAGAITGSGSVITKDVPADALAFERSLQTEKAGWAKAFRERRTAEKAAQKKG
ncbi:bifunctional UDP-N-acetylglucosamine diphosphorylase/glucosamine-1-phosphate N-acetyltransferase GlmU [Asticcacaulis excentricus]|uniref:Bifunctional protein GlmU n=1 Tax=Asticcacaulis excentricus (strain ATCC 15261 / DSM 4724 / KCTC 12464 / NCIMB 9791 / VKM B-1370 / CB 48) TaxID=573065 RepID=E8RQ80_ASTEC|nr:bifunctional UDP-N-acetylglucosamine diphosphorylase/glucosamine-1-phosphate N-acetyltransferase GlmU [Asticcacaulis excentricus]ADU13182.1 UDP-N-acetylglucosamine pyrophosphorylase [Asticcacaulis excentricus CB 48]